MSDRNIVRKELDVNKDTVLSDSDKHSTRDFYYSMREYLSTHNNPSVQNKSYMSLKPVNLKPFYIKPFFLLKVEYHVNAKYENPYQNSEIACIGQRLIYPIIQKI